MKTGRTLIPCDAVELGAQLFSDEEKTMNSGIYKIENTTNGKCYIGSSADLRARWSQHLSLLRAGKHHSAKLQHSWTKHGEAAFRMVLVEPVTDTGALLVREQWWFDTERPAFNIAPVAGCKRGVKLSEETKRRMSASRVGKTPSAETRAKMSAWQQGRKRPDETRQKISESKKAADLKGRPAWNKGKSHSDETRAKLSAARKGKPTWFGEQQSPAVTAKLQAAKTAAAARREA